MGLQCDTRSFVNAFRAVAVLFFCVAATTRAADGGAAAEAIVAELVETQGIPGMSAAVWRGDSLAWSFATGKADLGHDVAVSAETRFRLGSVSKVLTAGLVAKLAEQGKVDLDADIRTYLPAFPDKGHTITLRHLLGHLGGVRHYGAKDFDFTAPGGIIDLRLYKSTDDVLALFKDDPLVAPPGEKYLYSTFGYSLVMVVVEKAAGASFLDLLQSELLDSLEMKHTCGDDLRKIVPGRTDFYDRGPNGVIVQSYPVNAAYKWSGGGLLATAEDLARFGAAHLQPGFFSAETLNVMFTPQKTAASEETGVGIAWRIAKTEAGEPYYHHAGAMGGCRAVLVIYPQRRMAVALLSNLGMTPKDVESYAMRIADSFNAEAGE